MNRLYGLGPAPRVVNTHRHRDGDDVDFVHTIAADHPTARASMLLGLVIETAEGPCYANQHGRIHGPFADPAEAVKHLGALPHPHHTDRRAVLRHAS